MGFLGWCLQLKESIEYRILNIEPQNNEYLTSITPMA